MKTSERPRAVAPFHGGHTWSTTSNARCRVELCTQTRASFRFRRRARLSTVSEIVRVTLSIYSYYLMAGYIRTFRSARRMILPRLSFFLSFPGLLEQPNLAYANQLQRSDLQYADQIPIPSRSHDKPQDMAQQLVSTRKFAL